MHTRQWSAALALAAAGGLVCAQTPPRGAVINGCTTQSFTIPSWFVNDLQSATDGTVSFGLLNRATNSTTDVACGARSSAEGKLKLCSVKLVPGAEPTELQAAVQVDEEKSATVFVNQTWICSDRKGSMPLQFTAAGNSSVALSCTGSVCKATSSPLLVKGALSSPVAIEPMYAEGPTGHDTPGCTSAAQNPSWTLRGVRYTHQTGDGITVMPGRSLSLLVVNPVTGYSASCMPNALFDEEVPTAAGKRLSCSGNEFGAIDAGRYRSSTTASFDPLTFTLSLSQTWYCDDADPAKPLAITAYGAAVLPLFCVDEAIHLGPDQHDETITTCKPATPEIVFNGTLVSSTVLPPYSIEEPLPEPDGCTVSSILHPTWIFSAFTSTTSTAASAASGASPAIAFEIMLQTQNPGFQRPIAVWQGEALADGSGWYNCEIGPEGDIGQPLFPHACTFKYDAGTKELALRANWRCIDLDPERPIFFSGVTTTRLDTTLTCETVDEQSLCVTSNPAYSWTAGITNVTWHGGAP